MSAASMNGIVVEVLNRENYWTWSALVKNYLEGNDLWYDIIVPSSEDQKPNEEDPEWKRRNSRALHAVQLSCGNDALFQIRNSTKAKEAWGQLKTSYDKEDETHHESHQSPPVLYEQAHHESHQSRPVLYEQIIMSAPSMNGIVVEVLNRENYPNWRTLVKNYLMGNGLWYKIIYDDDEDEKNDDEGKKEQRKPRKENIEKDPELQSKNRRALHAIQLSCGKALGQIRKCIAAREAWDQLKISFSEDVKARRNVEQTRSDDDKTLQIFVRKGFLDDAKLGIDVFPDDIFLRSPDGRTVLHTAVAVGHVELVNKLVKIGNQRLLKMQDKKGYTALALAAKLTDNKEMAESMVKNGGEELLTIKSKALEHQGVDEIPVLLASLKGHKKMTRYLFTKTPWSALSQNSWEYGLMLLSRCISNEIFDVAAAILRHPDALQLPLYHPKKGLQPIYQLAHMPSAFFSTGTKLNWWKQFIYNILRVKDLKNEIIKIVFLEPDEMERPNIMTHTLPGRLLGQFQQFIQTLIVSKFAVFQKIHEKKMDHYLVLEILNCLCKRLPKMISEELHEASAYDAMLQAAKNGITEFIKSMKDANPDLLLAMDESKRGIFAHAIVNRQEEMFQLIHDIRSKEIITSVEDALGNNLMHIAAEIGPSRYLDGISNAALQMQRELQWFHEVKEVVPRWCHEAKDPNGKTASEVFTDEHKELLKSGQQWAKDTASSFTLVGTLIITIMFASAFTVPGGNKDDNGTPIFLGKNIFTFFIVSDAISLVTSSSSVLMFIGILTSRYAEEDFIKWLPLKLLFGLLTLFFSVASMMCAFCAALALMLKGYQRIVIAAMWLALLPILVFVPSLLRLTLEIYQSTVRFDKLAAKKKKKKQD